jgi:hypothetical protein
MGDAMKRRSGIGGKPIKGQHRKAVKPKRRDAQKFAVNSDSSRINREGDVARLSARASRGVGTTGGESEVLQVIRGSAGYLQPVFAAMLENAVRICDPTFGII